MSWFRPFVVSRSTLRDIPRTDGPLWNAYRRDMPPMSQLKPMILKRQERTPRFLFRVWHNKSGGDLRINTMARITPPAWLLDSKKQTVDKDFFGNSPFYLTEVAVGHLSFLKGNITTCYSSWSQSLPNILAWATHFGDDVDNEGISDLHLCVLDTNNLKHPTVILHTRAMHEILSPSIGDWYNHEYLAFGVVEGPGYEAVPFHTLSSTDLDKFLPSKRFSGEAFNPPGDVDYKLLGAARAIGAQFPRYNLPVQAHLLASLSHKNGNHKMIINALSDYPVPEEWLNDSDPMTLDIHGHTEAARGATILLDLAKQAHGEEEQMSTTAERAELEKSEKERQQLAQQALEADPRMPEEVKDRYKSAVGWAM